MNVLIIISIFVIFLIVWFLYKYKNQTTTPSITTTPSTTSQTTAQTTPQTTTQTLDMLFEINETKKQLLYNGKVILEFSGSENPNYFPSADDDYSLNSANLNVIEPEFKLLYNNNSLKEKLSELCMKLFGISEYVFQNNQIMLKKPMEIKEQYCSFNSLSSGNKWETTKIYNNPNNINLNMIDNTLKISGCKLNVDCVLGIYDSTDFNCRLKNGKIYKQTGKFVVQKPSNKNGKSCVSPDLIGSIYNPENLYEYDENNLSVFEYEDCGDVIYNNYNSEINGNIISIKAKDKLCAENVICSNYPDEPIIFDINIDNYSKSIENRNVGSFIYNYNIYTIPLSNINIILRNKMNINLNTTTTLTNLIDIFKNKNIIINFSYVDFFNFENNNIIIGERVQSFAQPEIINCELEPENEIITVSNSNCMNIGPFGRFRLIKKHKINIRPGTGNQEGLLCHSMEVLGNRYVDRIDSGSNFYNTVGDYVEEYEPC